MARKKKIPVDLGDPDYLPPQLISGTTDEQRDAEVAARIKETLIAIMNAMGDLPSIAEGDIVPDVELMQTHYGTLGIYIDKMQQRLERNEKPKKASAKNSKARRTSNAGMSNDFD